MMALKIIYRTKRLEKECTDFYEAQKKHGIRMAEIIHQRIQQIQAADSVDILLKYKIGRCHRLEGDRKEEIAMDLVHPFRLVFIETDRIELVRIQEIEDYH